MWLIVIDSQIVFINFSISQTICRSIKIIDLNNISVHVQIKRVPKYSPFKKPIKVPKNYHHKCRICDSSVSMLHHRLNSTFGPN